MIASTAEVLQDLGAAWCLTDRGTDREIQLCLAGFVDSHTHRRQLRKLLANQNASKHSHNSQTKHPSGILTAYVLILTAGTNQATNVQMHHTLH